MNITHYEQANRSFTHDVNPMVCRDSTTALAATVDGRYCRKGSPLSNESSQRYCNKKSKICTVVKIGAKPVKGSTND